MLFNLTPAYSDELFLKDGSIIECKILNYKDNESYRILFKDGSVVTYPADKVKSFKISDATLKDDKGETLPAKSDSGTTTETNSNQSNAPLPVIKQEKGETLPSKSDSVNPTRIDSYQTIAPVPARQERTESPVKFLASFSIVISPDYRDMLDDAYPEADVTGGYGWLGIDLGAQFKVVDNLTISPTVGLLFNYVSVEYEYYYGSSYIGKETDDYLNYIVLPRIAARYKFISSPISPYIGAELNYNEPNTGSDRYELESGGLGYGVFIGFSPTENMILEAGYLYVPVEWNYKGYDFPSDKNNIGGGVLIRVGGAF